MAPLNRTVDMVVVGTGPAAVQATVDGLRRGLRVLVLIRSQRASLAAKFRRATQHVAASPAGFVTILTGVQVVCVGGVHSVEAVVIRRIASGRLLSVNTSSLLTF